MASSFVWADPDFWRVWLAAFTGWVVCTIFEQTVLQPRPIWFRALGSWLLQIGLWCVLSSVLVVIIGRPWFAISVGIAFYIVLVLVSNAKCRALREPFLFQDYDYFLDAIRHPRLYIPFLGWAKFFAATVGVIAAVGAGLWLEQVAAHRWDFAGQLGGVLTLMAVGLVLLLLGERLSPEATFKPNDDVRDLGLLGSFWRYAVALRQPINVVSPYQSLPVSHALQNSHVDDLPNLIAVQSESFFDPRPLFSGINQEVMAEFDRIRAESRMQGSLIVPAWGANTIRTEFAFLSGLSAQILGVQQFSPFRPVARGWAPMSMASWLSRLGYRTICIHPYPASFYQRNLVYPRLGFDMFLDIDSFQGVSKEGPGPYVPDAAVTEKVEQVLRSNRGPIFIFAITMENHGPLHLEQTSTEDREKLYREPPPMECEDLTVYLRHLANANRMLGDVRSLLDASARRGSLCWYGDHVPIMPKVYQNLGYPDGSVPFLCWDTDQLSQLINTNEESIFNDNMAVSDLSSRWLQGVGLMQTNTNVSAV